MKAGNEMIKRQKAFYENKEKNLVTRFWYFIRNRTLNSFRKELGLEEEIHQLHLKWLGELKEKKVLDLGCYEGNSLSFHLAENSKEYVGIDLSERAIDHLSKRLNKFPHARVYAVDFLSEDFKEKDFDLIYAYGVLHHFKDTDDLIIKLKEKMKPNGQIISYDPLSTSLPVKTVRKLYRPFQSDKDWEWPFSKKVYYKYAENFEILERKAVLGKTKWLFLINGLPISAEKKSAISKKWHQEDISFSKDSDRHMFQCMQLTMLMQFKTN
ncbi:class I SAM-dependent methyltransferase [Gramella lutea]|uniref:Class I SAM-dependent methyltransferase n=1 Tax=Christiangramia lutea TaxID=1607951 RepID=A0A9X1V075_9FLAO|nr:class I SAM-dependent methyltransferase [Christiangramia lutea]MCH4821566.1 class I SAM-dependent methyltransferase [Christiangramia lutea]